MTVFSLRSMRSLRLDCFFSAFSASQRENEQGAINRAPTPFFAPSRELRGLTPTPTRQSAQRQRVGWTSRTFASLSAGSAWRSPTTQPVALRAGGRIPGRRFACPGYTLRLTANPPSASASSSSPTGCSTGIEVVVPARLASGVAVTLPATPKPLLNSARTWKV